MIENAFRTIFALVFYAVVALPIYYSRNARRNCWGVDIKDSKPNMIIRAVFGLGYVGAMIAYIFAPSLFDWTDILLPNWARWISALITAGSVLLLYWVNWALDAQFDTSLDTQAKHKLINHRPYPWVRHSMYTALFLMGLGWFLLNANWSVGVPVMAGIILVALSRVQNEEDMLTDHFGDEYREYMQRSSLFFPLLVAAN